jgi:hypothetical protein
MTMLMNMEWDGLGHNPITKPPRQRKAIDPLKRIRKLAMGCKVKHLARRSRKMQSPDISYNDGQYASRNRTGE